MELVKNVDMDSSIPIVSVIIPVYNRVGLLNRALSSVLKQTYKNLEICLIDDGSTDGSKDILNLKSQLKEFNITFISHANNKGAATARNTGIKAAKGDYIAFIDSDDEWYPHKIEQQLKKLLSCEDKAILACCTGYFLNQEAIFKQDNRESICMLNKIPNLHTLLRGCYLSPGSTLFVHKSAFDKVGLFDENLRRFEDWDWLIRYYQSGLKLSMVEEGLAKIYVLSKPKMQSVKQPLSILLKKHKYFNLKETLLFRSSLAITLSSCAFYENKIFTAIKYALFSMLLYPFRSFSFFKKVICNVFLFFQTRLLASTVKTE